MTTHVKVLGVLNLVVGGCFLVGAMFLALVLGGTAGIVGAAAEAEDAAIAIPILGIAGSALTIFLLAFALPNLIIGWGLLTFKSWARIAGIVLAAISLIIIPFGTILGIYGLWVLLNKDTERLFDAPVAVSRTV